MTCPQELCRNWTGSGCICQVLDLEPDVVEEDDFDLEPDVVEDKCRPVEVDGEVIRVLGGAEMDATDRAMFAEIVRAAKRRFSDDRAC